MHELGVAQKIVEAANRAAENNQIKRVSKVRLKLGQMAAAHPDQLQFGFTAYAKGSRLTDCKLEIEEVLVELECTKCKTKFGDLRFNDHEFAHTVAHAPMTYIPQPCPKCKADGANITHGQEMELVDLEGE